MRDDHARRAFSEALKLAAPDATGLVARFTPALRNIGSLGGIGALAGAGLGGAAGTAEYLHRKRERRMALPLRAYYGLRAGVRGAATGALLGASVGGLAGAVSKKDWSDPARLGGHLGAASRFGQRQVHGITGMLSPEELEAIGGGAHDARQVFRHAIATNPEATGALEDTIDALKAHLRGDTETASELRASADSLAQSAFQARRLRRAREAFRSAEEAQRLGLTSIPGYLRAIGDPNIGLGKAIGAGIKEQLANAPRRLATPFTLVTPALALMKDVASEKEVRRGRGRGERVLGSAGELAGGVMTGAMPIGAGLLAAAGLHRAGGLVGRGIDQLRGVDARRRAPRRRAGSPGQGEAESGQVGDAG